VPKQSRLEVRLSSRARSDIANAIKTSFAEFGEAASVRYEALISQALNDLAHDPQRPGSQARPDLLVEGARAYHLSFSRKMAGLARVKKPRHFLLYRAREEAVEVIRLLHDAGDLERHIPKEPRTFD
jgi:toxin ParE1/3/4